MKNAKSKDKVDGCVYAANKTKILTYGSKNAVLDLGLDKLFVFDFVLADIDVAILGTDFLSKFGICIDIRNRRIFNKNSSAFSKIDHSDKIYNI